MPTNHAYRVARRFRQDNTCTSRRAHVWAVPGRRQDIPDELIVGHSQGSTLTSAEVEATLAKAHDIVAGSCSFETVTTKGDTNKVHFQFSTTEGQVLKGIVVVNAIAFEDRLSAYSIIEVDELEGST